MEGDNERERHDVKRGGEGRTITLRGKKNEREETKLMKHGHLDLQIKRIHLSTLQLGTPPIMGNSSERKGKVNESQKCTVLINEFF